MAPRVDGTMVAMSSSTPFAGPVAVSVAYMLLWYVLLLGHQRGTKYRRKAALAREGQVFDRYFGRDGEMLAADRAVMNTLEQMGPFLLGLWMCAAFYSASFATGLGAVYVVLRAVYPFLLGRSLSNINPKRVALVTIPCYAIVFTLLGTAAGAALM